MSGNICGNCANFKPKPGEQFFNCTRAKHAGLSYGMQVRTNTQACEAFALNKPSPAQRSSAQVAQSPPTAPRIPSTEKKAAPAPGAMKPVTAGAASSSSGAARKPAPQPAPLTEETAAQAAEAGGISEEGRAAPSERGRLCAWGKGILIMAVVFAIALVSGLTYLCAFSGEEPLPPITAYYQQGQATETSREILNLVSSERSDRYVRGDYYIFVSLYVDADLGTDFVIVEATITNVGDSALSISPDDFKLRDSKGRDYNPSTYYGAAPFPKKKLAPMETANGRVLFIVPEVISGLELTRLMPSDSGEQPILGVWKLPF